MESMTLMSGVSVEKPEKRDMDAIQWPQLWSLAALYASIIIGWIAYYNYQPQLLAKYNFTGFSFLLIIVQGIILVVTPPIAGRFGDKYRFKKGHRIPIITAGMSFAAMIFMAVSFTLFSDPGEIFRWILPVLIVFWLFGMSIFTSPALSTLELFTPVDRIPRAMAILTIVSNLIYALEPVIVDIIEFLGAPATFITGGAIVFISGYALKKNSLSLFNGNTEAMVVKHKDETRRSEPGFIFFMGIVLGLVTTILFNLLPDVLYGKLSVNLPGIPEGKWLLFILLSVSAIISLPLSDFVNKIGLKRSFVISALAGLLSAIPLFIFGSTILLVLFLSVFVISFTTLAVSSLPLAISKSGFYEKVFCVGVFFSGVALPQSVVESILGYQ